MKRTIYLILALLLMGVARVSAQQIAVFSRDGSEVKFEWGAQPCSKITFSNGQMLFHAGDAVNSTFNIKDVLRIDFYDLNASVDKVGTDSGISYNPIRKELVVSANPGTAISIYRTCGACVWSQLQTIAAPAISVAHLPAGTYVVVAGSETLKFVKL